MLQSHSNTIIGNFFQLFLNEHKSNYTNVLTNDSEKPDKHNSCENENLRLFIMYESKASELYLWACEHETESMTYFHDKQLPLKKLTMYSVGT